MVKTGYVEAEGNTNNSVYKLSDINSIEFDGAREGEGDAMRDEYDFSKAKKNVYKI